MLIRLCFLALSLGSLPYQPAEATASCRKALLGFAEGARQGQRIRDYFESYEPFNLKADPLTFGIEVEGLLPAQLHNRVLSQIVIERVSKIAEISGIKIKPDGNSVTYYKGGKLYRIDFGTDNSLTPPHSMRGVEIRSPILRDPTDIDLFLMLIDDFRSLTGLREAEDGGVHIHVGFKKPRIGELSFMLELFRLIESELFSEFAVRESRLNYAGWTHPKTLELVDQYYNEKQHEFFLIQRLHEVGSRHLDDPNFYEVSRFQGLNLLSLGKYGTIEFRLFNSSIRGSEIIQMLGFAKGFTTAVREKNSRLLELFLGSDKQSPFARLINIFEAPSLEPAKSPHGEQ